METHIQICAENQTGCRPVIYKGKYNDRDFVNRDVIAGELLQNMLKRFHEYDITEENLVKVIDKGHKIVITLWKESENTIKH